MKMTTNRKLTLLVLSQDADSDQPPPHSASTVAHMFENAFNYKWPGYEALKQIPNKQQIHRTLKELWYHGLIVGSRFKEELYGSSGLPYWVIRYQLSSDVERNHLTAKCNDLHRKVHKAKHGANFFGSVFDMGLSVAEVAVLAKEVKTLLQKTHPDKAAGLVDQFKQMVQCRDWIKAGIPLPTPTHTAGEAGIERRTLTG